MSQYFKEIKDATKTLATGLKVTMKEYFTPKSTEQYPENRKTTLHVAKRHRGRLVFKRVEDPNDPQAVKRGLKVGDYKCTACTMCEKACPNDTIKITSHMETDPETGKKKKVLDDYQYDLGDCMFCEISMPSSSPTTSRTPSSTAASWCCTSTRRSIRVARCPTSSTVAHR